MPRYRCLIVDHDDTVVNSTASVHYPCFVAYTAKFCPTYPGCTLREYWLKNFHPGITSLLEDDLGLDDEGIRHEQTFWNDYVAGHTPAAFPGIREALEAQRQSGGLICVVSHSLSHNILRDYKANQLPTPDGIYGWDMEPSLRKPNPWPVRDIMRRWDLAPDDILVLDDLKPGYDMARAAGVAIAGAGWANDVQPIQDFMRDHCDYYFATPQAFADFITAP